MNREWLTHYRRQCFEILSARLHLHAIQTDYDFDSLAIAFYMPAPAESGLRPHSCYQFITKWVGSMVFFTDFVKLILPPDFVKLIPSVLHNEIDGKNKLESHKWSYYEPDIVGDIIRILESQNADTTS